MTPVSVVERLLHHPHDVAAQRHIGWDVILRADAAEAGSRDWMYLTTVIGMAFDAFDTELRALARNATVLLTAAGPFARHEQIAWLERLLAGLADDGSPCCAPRPVVAAVCLRAMLAPRLPGPYRFGCSLYPTSPVRTYP